MLAEKTSYGDHKLSKSVWKIEPRSLHSTTALYHFTVAVFSTTAFWWKREKKFVFTGEGFSPSFGFRKKWFSQEMDSVKFQVSQKKVCTTENPLKFINNIFYNLAERTHIENRWLIIKFYYIIILNIMWSQSECLAKIARFSDLAHMGDAVYKKTHRYFELWVQLTKRPLE